MKRITDLRLRRGWTKAELARRSCLHPSQIGQIESGRVIPYPVQLEKLASALEWPLEQTDRLMEEVEHASATA